MPPGSALLCCPGHRPLPAGTSRPGAGRRAWWSAGGRRPRRAGQTLGDLLRVQDLLPSSRVDSNPDGTMEVPRDYDLAGWFTGGVMPGEDGPAVISDFPAFALLGPLIVTTGRAGGPQDRRSAAV
jgi:hypothetical protein